MGNGPPHSPFILLKKIMSLKITLAELVRATSQETEEKPKGKISLKFLTDVAEGKKPLHEKTRSQLRKEKSERNARNRMIFKTKGYLFKYLDEKDIYYIRNEQTSKYRFRIFRKIKLAEKIFGCGFKMEKSCYGFRISKKDI